MMDTTSMLANGTIIRSGTYRVERALSSGGFGNTYVVRNVAFDEIFAMKEFFMKGINVRNGDTVTVSQTDNYDVYETQRKKFREEAQCLRKLKNDHIVKVYDMFEENGTEYYVMDFIDGQSAAQLMASRHAPLTEQETRKIMMQVLDALKTVHAQQVWHLDIKPANIMLDKHGRAYLIDFGASKQIKNTDKMTTTPTGYTQRFAPTEQVEQEIEKFGPWTDFYALGATLYNLQTGERPPASTDIAEGGAFNFPTQMSDQMKRLIEWMMSPKRSQRPQSVSEVEQFLGGTDVSDVDVENVASQDTVLSAVHKSVQDTVSSEETMIDRQLSSKKKGNNIKPLAIIIGVLIVLAIIGGIIAMSGNSEATPPPVPETTPVLTEDTDSIKAVQEPAEQQHNKDTLTTVPKKQNTEQKTSKPTESSGTKDLGYATFEGSWPNDVNGRMVFRTSHIIDSRDPKQRMAEPGDYVIGEFVDGKLVQGILYDSNNQVKGSIIIGI